MDHSYFFFLPVCSNRAKRLYNFNILYQDLCWVMLYPPFIDMVSIIPFFLTSHWKIDVCRVVVREGINIRRVQFIGVLYKSCIIFFFYLEHSELFFFKYYFLLHSVTFHKWTHIIIFFIRIYINTCRCNIHLRIEYENSEIIEFRIYQIHNI